VRRVLVASLVILLLAAAVLAGLDASGRLPGGLVADPAPTPSPTRPIDPSPVAVGPVLTPEPTSTATEPPPALPPLREGALRRVLGSGDLGPDPGAVVLDVATGRPLLAVDPATPRTPASVAKLATGAAVLRRLDPGSRLRTVVRSGATPGSLVLVGAGDASLLTRPSNADPYADHASLVDLAARTATALRADGVASVTLAVDDSLFEGPAVSPDWPSTYVGSGVVSPVSALSVDAGRVSIDSDVREADPAVAAGRAFARLLARRGVEVTGAVRRAAAPAPAAEVAAVESPTLAQLVELMLQTSDNDLAEALLRLVAVGSDRPGTFVDGRAVVAQVLGEIVGPDTGTELLDGSGLARGSVVPPEVLAQLLVAAGQGDDLWRLVSGLPVAGFSGTLSTRFLSDVPLTSPAAGEVRAKTGTLTGVSTLAGTASVDGRPVVLVVMGNDVTDTLAARAALDRFAALVASG
jgi:D-alanyl-D-alanine carboxypeptidase/D-alanyl-D-alanine-endopeptidase (penicillin-binding protein 4)